MKKNVILFTLCILVSFAPLTSFGMELSQEWLDRELIMAVCRNELDEVERLLDRGASANATAQKELFSLEKGTPVLLYALFIKANEKICQRLLSHGANINAHVGCLPSRSHTPTFCVNHGKWQHHALSHHKGSYLISAACCGHPSICKLFLDYGARLELEDDLLLNTFPLIAKYYSMKHDICVALSQEAFKNAGFIEDQRVKVIKEEALACRSKYESICNMLVNHLQEIVWQHNKENNPAITLLLSLNRLKKEGHPTARLLYTQRRALLVPHLALENYISMRNILRIQDEDGKTAYDYFPIDCLNPDYQEVVPSYPAPASNELAIASDDLSGELKEYKIKAKIEAKKKCAIQ